MKKRSNKGITLIALVVTIIILIILAGVSISIVLGDSGVVTKANYAKEQQKIAEITEKLILYKGDLQIETLNDSTLEKYLQKILDEGIIEESDIQETGKENSRYITVEDKYIFLIEEEENKNIKIEYLGTTSDISLKIKVTYYIDEDNIKTQEFSYGESVLEPSFTISKEDYIFVGWKEDNSEEGEVLTSKVMENEPITLYAVWEPVLYSITYNLSIGTLPADAVIEYSKITETFDLPTPTGTDYAFAGWYDNENLEGTAITQIEKGTMGEKVFYAKEHQHTGTSGTSSSNGCYTTKQANGKYCPGHYWETYYNSCGRCGQNVGTGTSCTNNVCAKDKPMYKHVTASGYNYCSGGCVTKYIYVLGCEYKDM